MKYAEIKRQTLELANMNTIAGETVPGTYNNQQDYLNKIPSLINTALGNIRTLVKRSPEVYELEEGEPVGNMIRYSLPGDFYALKTGGVCRVYKGRFEKTNLYRLQGRNYILVPKDAPGNYMVEYYRYPVQLPLNPSDDYDMEEDPEVIQTAMYYAAAYLVLPDDQFMYTVLYNDYESRLGRISPGITAELQQVDDVYAFNTDWGYQ